MKSNEIFEALQAQFDSQADEKAGYPPNCNKGYVEKDGKCVPAEENSESFKHGKKNDNDEEKNGDDKKKNGDDKKKNGNPFDKKKKKKK